MSTRLLRFSSFLQALYKLSTKKIIFTRKSSVLAFQQKKVRLSRVLRSRVIDFLKIYSHCENFEILIYISLLCFLQTTLFFPKTTFYQLPNKKNLRCLTLLVLEL